MRIGTVLIIVSVLLLVGTLAYRVINTISSDALTMALGLLFGVLAGVPMALMMLAAGREQERRRRWGVDDDYHPPRQIPEQGNTYITHHHLHVYGGADELTKRQHTQLEDTRS